MTSLSSFKDFVKSSLMETASDTYDQMLNDPAFGKFLDNKNINASLTIPNRGGFKNYIFVKSVGKGYSEKDWSKKTTTLINHIHKTYNKNLVIVDCTVKVGLNQYNFAVIGHNYDSARSFLSSMLRLQDY